MDKEKAKAELKILLDRYNQMKLEKTTDVRSKEEEKTKTKLIRPLFEHVLGWKFEEDVTPEERISKGWVDYGFRINEVSKFFLEAKSLKEDLDNPVYFRQAVSYAYYKGCPWAVLTNFETIKILNAEWEAPNYLYSHFMTINCYDFLERFDDLWLLSREGFEQGLLNKLAERFGKKTKKSPLTRQLLEDFTRFRNALSKNITKENQSKKITEEELDESVQRILNRLIFIRNCEDRGLEEKKLWEAHNEARVWKTLKDVFRYYDTNYDSKLFSYDLNDPKSVHVCDTLTIDDLVMREIIDGLYRTKDKSVSYDFSIIPADTLGTVYEQYLSHILKKTKQRASLSDNQVHRKTQGVYYTPTYIVEYIVRNTLGEMLSQKNVDLEKLRVLDISCGSGSFLIKTFDVLDEYYQETNLNQTKLDLETEVLFKRKVLLLKDHIFGVDLDGQAVEIAQLNLLLKIAEKSHRLPLLQENIKRGNSLVDNHLAGEWAFDWNQQFKEIMKEGGFNVVIGNPPYVRQEELGVFKPYFEANYDSYKGTADLLVYFFEKGISLLKDKGYFGFIASNKFMRSDYGVNLRKYILKHCSIEKIVDFGELPVFEEASTFPCIFIFRKGTPTKNHKFLFCSVKTLDFKDLSGYVAKYGLEVDQSSLGGDTWSISEKDSQSIIRKIETQGVALKKYTHEPLRGILTGFNEAFVIDEETKNRLILADPKNSEIIKPTVRGKDIIPYGIEETKLWLIITKDGIDVPKDYPEIYKHLTKYQEALEKRDDQGKFWYNLRPCKYYGEFEKPKIIYGDISLQNRFTIDTKNYYPLKTCFIIPNADKYLLALLNSKLLEFYMRQQFPILGDPQKGGRMLHGTTYMNKVPIKIIDNIRQQPILRLVDKMLSLNECIIEIGDKKTDERTRLEEELKRIDKEINNLVYGIYGISEKERAIIEAA